jgi:quercetin dioxygenase-like cupin family protein
MPFVDVSTIEPFERLPGWCGRVFHTASMTFAHYEFARGASIHEHHHPQEEVWDVIEGELEITIDGTAQVVRPGLVAIVPGGVRHSTRALTDGRAIVVDHPLRHDVGQAAPQH